MLFVLVLCKMSCKTYITIALIICAVIIMDVCGNVIKNSNPNSSATHSLRNPIVAGLSPRRKKFKKHFRYLLPMIFGAILLKSVLFPLAFKAMAVMSSVSVVMSTFSLIVSSIVGYAKLALSQPSVVHYTESQKKIDRPPGPDYLTDRTEPRKISGD